jgi:hypothetical protein
MGDDRSVVQLFASRSPSWMPTHDVHRRSIWSGYKRVTFHERVHPKSSRLSPVGPAAAGVACGALAQGPKFIARISMIVMQSRLWLGHSSRGQEALKALIETRASYLGEEALIAHR